MESMVFWPSSLVRSGIAHLPRNSIAGALNKSLCLHEAKRIGFRPAPAPLPSTDTKSAGQAEGTNTGLMTEWPAAEA